MPCLIKPDMHHTCLRIIPCSCVVCLLCCVLLFRCLLLRVGSVNVVIVRTRSTTSVCLLHGLVLLPCGISSKMTIPSKSLLSLLASCSLFCYSYAAIPTTCLSCLLYCWAKPLTHFVLANCCLAMLPLLLSPSYSVASCRWSWSLFHVGTWICWDITIYLI